MLPQEEKKMSCDPGDIIFIWGKKNNGLLRWVASQRAVFILFPFVKHRGCCVELIRRM